MNCTTSQSQMEKVVQCFAHRTTDILLLDFQYIFAISKEYKQGGCASVQEKRKNSGYIMLTSFSLFLTPGYCIGSPVNQSFSWTGNETGSLAEGATSPNKMLASAFPAI